MRAEKVDHYCSSCGIGKISFSSSSLFLIDTVPFLMAPILWELGVKRELVKAEPKLVLLSELTLCNVGNFQKSHFHWILASGKKVFSFVSLHPPWWPLQYFIAKYVNYSLESLSHNWNQTSLNLIDIVNKGSSSHQEKKYICAEILLSKQAAGFNIRILSSTIRK